METLVPGTARVSAWAKGFRVSSRSEEFQVVVPPTVAELTGIELRVTEGVWPAILEPLYRSPPSLLEQEFAVLFDQNEVMVISVAPSVDRVARTSLVAVCAATAVSWDSGKLSEQLAKLKTLVSRLSRSYGTTFRGADDRVRNQLRGGAFLPERRFSLAGETRDENWPWIQVVTEVRKWNGISGVATKGLCGLGANILYGTRDEFERYRSTAQLAGFFDVARGEIQPEGKILVPWADVAEVPATIERAPAARQRTDAERLEEIAATLNDVRNGVDALRNGLDGWFGRLLAILERALKKRR